jgi:hypothetical protein
LSGNLKPWELLKRKLADVITTQARFYKQTWKQISVKKDIGPNTKTFFYYLSAFLA